MSVPESFPGLSPVQLPAALAQHASALILDLATAREALPLAMRLLSADELLRHQRFRQVADQQRFALGRACLRQVLAAPLACAPEVLEFVYGPFGKPMLAGPQRLHFNLSHAGRWVLIAWSEHSAIGADIETIQTGPLQTGLEQQVFSPAECALYGTPCAANDFYTVWTAKEAACKAWGCGLGDHLSALSVLPAAGPAGRLSLLLHGQALPEVHLYRLAAPAGTVASLCLSQGPQPDFTPPALHRHQSPDLAR